MSASPSYVEPTINNEKLFDLWADIYDGERNPLVTLNEAVSSALLPDLSGCDVLDVGCGTGRSFGLLRRHNAKTIVGVDSSRAMCHRAESRKMAEVRCGSCEELPMECGVVDYTICNLVLGYVTDLNAFARELRRVSRVGAIALLSDLHPDTASALGWRRTFRVAGREYEPRWSGRPVGEVIEAFEGAGWSLQMRSEHRFGDSEKGILEEHGKREYIASISDRPVLFVLLFRLEQELMNPELSLKAGRVAQSGQTSVWQSIKIQDGKIARFGGEGQVNGDSGQLLSVGGYLLLPGLVNAHDHLQFALFPRLGSGHYQNASEWASDIHERFGETIARHRSVSRLSRIWWGAIRNALCGVTTVCHHDELSAEVLDAELPVSVVEHMAWSHSLNHDPRLIDKARGADSYLPFVFHAAEGVDTDSAGEFGVLEAHGAINSNTCLVHGVGFDEKAIEGLNRMGATLICCPSSNDFLFGRCVKKETIERVRRLVLGSDSPLTAGGDLLDEIRYTNQRLGINPSRMYNMVLEAPAKSLRLRDGQGELKLGGVADIVAVVDKGLTPEETLARLSWRDIELVVHRGRVSVASDDCYAKLSMVLRVGLEPLFVEGVRRWVRAPIAWLFREAKEVVVEGGLSLGGKMVRRVSQ